VTPRQLLATWVAHDLDHVAQFSRVLARQYSGAVGPWRAYLRIVSGAQGWAQAARGASDAADLTAWPWRAARVRRLPAR
jgi:hypothetical protein